MPWVTFHTKTLVPVPTEMAVVLLAGLAMVACPEAMDQVPAPVVRWLEERGLEARAVASRWEGELETQSSDAPDASAGQEGEPDDEETAPLGRTSGRGEP